MISSRLRRRKQLLESTVTLLESIEMKLSYCSLPLYELIAVLSDEAFLKKTFIGRCKREIENGEDFPSAWEKAVDAEPIYKREEKAKLLQLGTLLGTSDLECQLKMLDAFTASFNAFSHSASEQCERYAATSVYLGLFCGLGLFVLLI